MHIHRKAVAVIGSTIVTCMGLTTVTASAATPATRATTPAVNLSRPMILAKGSAKPVAEPNGINVLYSDNWSGYAALPKTAGDTFTSIVGDYNVPSVVCSVTPNTFSYHWIGLDGWSDQTVEQDGIAADCNGTTPQYAAWFEMYPANFNFSFAVNPGDAIESAIHYLGNAKYELSLKDVTTGRGFDVTKTCPVSICENSSAEAITEAYYYNKRYAGTSDFGNEYFQDVTVTDSAGNFGGLFHPKSWKTGEGIALGEYGDVDTTPGPLSTAPGLGASSAFTVFWSREN
jgi:Peptidase A4 family